MADDQQQTRVLLLNGQTIILQGDATDNCISDINADLLQQALQEATGGSDNSEEPRSEDYEPDAPPENSAPSTDNNLVAIFQGDQGETHTIQLTMEQAEALGLHFMCDENKQSIASDLTNVNQTEMAISNDRNNLVYSENTTESEGQKSLFESCINTEPDISNIQGDTNLQGNSSPTTATTTLQSSIGGLSALPDVGSYISDSNNITLIPQFVNGQMTYTVKLNEQPSNSIHNRDFSVIEQENGKTELPGEQKSKLPLLAPALPSSPLTTNSSTPTATTMSSLRINSIPTMMNSLTPIAPSLSPSSITNTTYVTQKSLLTPISNITATDKTTKYVVVSSSNSSTSSSPSTSLLSSTSSTSLMKGSSIMRAIARPVITHPPPLQPSKSTSVLASSVATSSALTGIPLINSNINITRTSTAGNSLLQSVSTPITGGGMIRVVAGPSPRVVQVPSTNGPKFTNILTPSGRLVATSNPQHPTQKIMTAISASGITKTTSIVTTSTTPTVTTEPLQSNAINAVQTTAARLNFNSNKPLGSSENPIQLVQQGQTFHSVQALSQEQLRQIATVLQQQHLDTAPRTKNVLYDAETNTRIIYRVVYPEDLDLREPSSPSERPSVAAAAASSVAAGGVLATAASSRGRGRRGRPPKSALRPLARTLPPSAHDAVRKATAHAVATSPTQVHAHTLDIDLDEDRLLDDASKVERKKQIARTRSGRVSRPPRHMVKDYKRLHHLDFADADLDDSDGGYSDYQTSDRENDAHDAQGLGAPDSPAPNAQEAGPLLPDATATPLLPGLQTAKRKISSHFRCPTCQKVYLGHSRMARHFSMFPDHGNIDQLNATANSSVTPAPSSPMPLPDSTQGKMGVGSLNGIVRPSIGRRRGKRRGPWAYTTPEARSERRKVKLREAMGLCEAHELSEVAGPAIASSTSLWELLLLRVEAVRAEESLVATLCKELRGLLEKVQSVVGDILQPLPSTDAEREAERKMPKEYYELQDELLCNALGLPSGKYQIEDDYLLSSRAQAVIDSKPEPPFKRLKSDEDVKEDIKQETKPTCPEVLSALALESRPAAVQISVTSEVTSTVAPSEASSSQPSSPIKSPTDGDTLKISLESTSTSQTGDVKEDAALPETKAISDHEDEHPFLLPPTSDMCVDELTHEPVSEGEHHGTETVDDIVNERLKNLTGFSVSVPENEPIQETSQSVPEYQNSHNTSDPVVPTFDPELALAAMGEGEQPSAEPSLTQFTPEIALAAMGEGDQEHQEGGHQHTSFNPNIQPVFNTLKSMEEVSNKEAKESEKNMSNRNGVSDVFSNMNIGNVGSTQTETPIETKEDIVTFTTSMLTNNSENTFITSLAESASSLNKCSGPNPSVTNFDPEIALAAMGEGDPTSNHAPIHTETNFDPEMALASMEGDSTEASIAEYHHRDRHSTSENEPAFQLTGMDVSLDESGPDLDFDALSAEFTRTTRHS